MNATGFQNSFVFKEMLKSKSIVRTIHSAGSANPSKYSHYSSEESTTVVITQTTETVKQVKTSHPLNVGRHLFLLL